MPVRVDGNAGGGTAEADCPCRVVPFRERNGERAVEGVARAGRLDRAAGAERRHEVRAARPVEQGAPRTQRNHDGPRAALAQRRGRLARLRLVSHREPGQRGRLALVRRDVVAETEQVRRRLCRRRRVQDRRHARPRGR